MVPRAALESARSFPKFPECPFTFTTATGIWEVIWVKVANRRLASGDLQMGWRAQGAGHRHIWNLCGG